ncbi:MAG: serine/threonine protein kinase [Planctomycetota bacterium]|jgi:serine/threonine protein kinase
MNHTGEETDDRSDGQEVGPTIDGDPGIARVGGKIDRYKLISVLGEGGCGMVYLAEQRTPVTRRVALKVIKPGMDTKQVIARFEAERQALALLDHPNIASVHDAGTTKTGRPYFVMEFVKGVSVTEHCDREKLGIEARLGLFLQVCEAVQYAHQKGIIHRDIKPSNIQVAIHGEKAVPKIIDFGLAKALTHLLTERTLVTEQGQMVGTPEYMSPEQAEMTNQDIDTRTDIYSLGAVLYELLTGTLPFDPDSLREGGAENIRRTIREKDPKTPSTRLSTIAGEESQKVARSRNTDVRTLSRRLHGDLDWITIRAMEKDRMRRYQTAQALAEDIQRHLDHEPVLAGPPSKVYRMKKFLRKHRALVAGVATVLAVLIGGVVVSTLFAVRAERARVEAESVSSFLRNDVLASMNPFNTVSPFATKGQEVTVRSFLDNASEKLEGRFPDKPLVEASIRTTLGTTYMGLGFNEPAESHLKRALAVYRAQLGAEDPATLDCTMGLGMLYFLQNRYNEAETLLAEATRGLERVRGAEDPNTLLSMAWLGWVYNARGPVAEAERLFVRCLETSERVQSPESLVGVAASAYGLAFAHHIQGHYGKAERLYKRSLEIHQRERGEDDMEMLNMACGLGNLYRDLGTLRGSRATSGEGSERQASHPGRRTSRYSGREDRSRLAAHPARALRGGRIAAHREAQDCKGVTRRPNCCSPRGSRLREQQSRVNLCTLCSLCTGLAGCIFFRRVMMRQSL